MSPSPSCSSPHRRRDPPSPSSMMTKKATTASNRSYDSDSSDSSFSFTWRTDEEETERKKNNKKKNLRRRSKSKSKSESRRRRSSTVLLETSNTSKDIDASSGGDNSHIPERRRRRSYRKSSSPRKAKSITPTKQQQEERATNVSSSSSSPSRTTTGKFCSARTRKKPSPPSPMKKKEQLPSSSIAAPAASATPASSAKRPGQEHVDKLKARIEHSLLIQDHEVHKKRLDQQRKQFRKRTDLKTWPLQEMAFEHLDYLIRQRQQRRQQQEEEQTEKNQNKQQSQSTVVSTFHGGDYLSSESSSSIESGRLAVSKKKVSNVIASIPVTESSGSNEQHQEEEEDDDDEPAAPQQLQQNVEQNNNNKFNDDDDDDDEPLWSMEPRVFATEKSQGKRKYVVGHYGRIADWYWRKSTPTNRHLYEVIRESTPCRLYFDFEYIKAYNKQCDSSSGGDKDSVTTPPFEKDKEEEQLMEEFLEELSFDLQTFYGLPPLDPSTQVVNLDSSTDKKFSRHWIVLLHNNNNGASDSTTKQITQSQSPEESVDGTMNSKNEKYRSGSDEILFKDAVTVGRFVKRLVGRLADELAVEGGEFEAKRPTLAKFLFVNTEPPPTTQDNDASKDGKNAQPKAPISTSKKTCFIDLGVYTRNRLFRCLGSSKFGKTVRLESNSSGGRYMSLDLPSSSSETASDETDGSKPETCKTLSLEEFIVANDWKPHARILADSLIIPLHTSLRPLRSIGDGENTQSGKFINIESSVEDENLGQEKKLLDVPEGSFSGITSSNVAGRGGSGDGVGPISRGALKHKSYTPSYPISQKSSPLPSLDKFVSTVLARRGESNNRTGSIRAWSIQYGPHDTPVSFTYQMQRNRFCELVGRQHKSNNVFWTIHVDSWTCMQGCHDPDCHGWGSPIPISNANGELDAIQEEFRLWQDEVFEQALLNLNLDEMTKPTLVKSEQQQQVHKDDDDDTNDEFGDALSDEALLQAVMDNPELFP